MLNPSTADAEKDDPTIRRCIAFSKQWGCGSLYVGNLYAYRSTDPEALGRMGAMDARGPDNIEHLRAMSDESSRLICAWGLPGGKGWPMTLKEIRRPAQCLGRTKHGAPRHPLYVKQTTELEAYP